MSLTDGVMCADGEGHRIVGGGLDATVKVAMDEVGALTSTFEVGESRDGRRFMHGGPGSFMFVPQGVPHAFANTTRSPTKMLFQSSVPGGHENYFEELAAILRRSDGRPDPKDIAELRARYDIEQLTPLAGGGSGRAHDH